MVLCMFGKRTTNKKIILLHYLYFQGAICLIRQIKSRCRTLVFLSQVDFSYRAIVLPDHAHGQFTV